MFGLFRIKSLIFGLFLASPGLAAWAYLGMGSVDSVDASPQVSLGTAGSHGGERLRVPVEVIAKGSPPQWVYVEVPPQAIPEPGLMTLLALASGMLVFRRKREASEPVN